MKVHGVALRVLLLVLSLPVPGVAQEGNPDRADQGAANDSAEVGVSPGWAFARSVVIPGWGHASVGSYTRGGFYFFAEAATGWMLFKSVRSLAAARERRDLIRQDAEALLLAGGAPGDSLEVLLDDDRELADARSLVEAREQQREDWLTFGLFMLLLGGADAFVSAHLADFPQPVDMETSLTSSGEAVEVKVSVPWGGPWGWGGGPRRSAAGR